MRLRACCMLVMVVASAFAIAACSRGGTNAPLSDAAYVDQIVPLIPLIPGCDPGQPADNAVLGKALKQRAKAWSAIRPPSSVASLHNSYARALTDAGDAFLKSPTTPAERANASALLDSAVSRWGDWYAAFSTTYPDRIFRVEGASMQPVLNTGVVLPIHPVEGAIKRWDIVVFKLPSDPSRDFIKRVVGLPGETVEVHDGKVYVNGAAVKGDTYAKDTTDYTYAPHAIPDDSYWVLGDNRGSSFDSHAWGTDCDPQQQCDFVPKNSIRGVLPADTKGCRGAPGS